MDIPIGSVNNYNFKQNHQELNNNDYSQLRSPCLQPPFYQGGSQVPVALGTRAFGYMTNEDIKRLLHKGRAFKPNFNK